MNTNSLCEHNILSTSNLLGNVEYFLIQFHALKSLLDKHDIDLHTPKRQLPNNISANMAEQQEKIHPESTKYWTTGAGTKDDPKVSSLLQYLMYSSFLTENLLNFLSGHDLCREPLEERVDCQCRLRGSKESWSNQDSNSVSYLFLL